MRIYTLLLFLTFFSLPTFAKKNHVRTIVSKSHELIDKINFLFQSRIILEVDNELECSKFIFFMSYRPPGFEFKNNGTYAIVCTNYIENLLSLYPINEALVFHLFILAHESIHLLYGKEDINQNISVFLKQQFSHHYGPELDASDLQHLNIDVLAMKILLYFNHQLKLNLNLFSRPFLNFPQIMGLYQDDPALTKRLTFREAFIKKSMKSYFWNDYVMTDSLCEFPYLMNGIKKLGIFNTNLCFNDDQSLPEIVKLNIQSHYSTYLHFMKR